MTTHLDEAAIPRIWSTVVDDDGVGVRRQVPMYKHLYAQHGPNTIIRTSKRHGLFSYQLGNNEDETVANRKRALERYNDGREYRIRQREDDDIAEQLLRTSRKEEDKALAARFPVDSEPTTPVTDISVSDKPVEAVEAAAVDEQPVKVAAVEDTPVAEIEDPPVDVFAIEFETSEDKEGDSDSDSGFDDGASFLTRDVIETMHLLHTVTGYLRDVFCLTTLLYRSL
jgi:hypothetical protein